MTLSSVGGVAPRIAFIGGGSYQWIPKLLLDIAGTPSLAEAEIVIEDIDPGPVPAMVDFVHHVARVRGIGLTATGTTDQAAALDGTDYVVLCISTGKLESMQHDVGVPERYGIRQSVGDTVGPGGILRGLRNIPVVLDIASDVERYCPDALLLNLTNPMTTITRAVLAHTGVPTVGLCHEVTIAMHTVALLLGCDVASLQPTVAGVNHLPIVTALDLDGADGLARLRAVLDDPDELARPLVLPGLTGHEAVSLGGRFTVGSLLASNRVKLELFDRHGVLPAAGDRHLVEFFAGFLTEESGWGERWGVGLTSMDDRRQWLADYTAEFDRLRVADDLPDTPSGELVATLIDARERDHPRDLPLNIANHGQVPDLPDGVVVESMVTVDAAGVRGRDVVPLPPVLREQVRRVSASQELVVEAALTGDRALVRDAFFLDPLAGRIDEDARHRLADEMLAATAAWLPRFAAPG